MSDLFPPTLAEQIAEVKREIGMRDRVYPRQVANGQMSQARADKALCNMRAVLATLEKLASGADQ